MQASELTHSNECLGRVVNIIKSRNTRNSNRSGTIVNETKNMLYMINQNSKITIRIPKSEVCEYEICHLGGTFTLDGKRLLGRPEELVNVLR